LAHHFRLIDEQFYQSIVVWYENPVNGNNSYQLIDLLRSKGPERWLMRKLQRFLVNVPLKLFAHIQKLGFVEEVIGYWIQNSTGLYKPGIGLQVNDTFWRENLIF